MKERYQRQIILPGFGEEAQEKLAHAKVLVTGAGGLGCPVLQILAAGGVGFLGIIDFDTVSLSNLHRQTLFSENDIGRKKVEAAKEKLIFQYPELKCEIYDFALEPAHAFDLIQNYDVIVDCTDDIHTKYLINDVCGLLKKPLVYASIYQFEGQVSVFHYGKKAGNLRDIFPEIPRNDTTDSCEQTGVMGVLTSTIGNLQANEVFKIIIGSGKISSGKILIYNHLNNEFQTISFAKKINTFRAESPEEILRQHYKLNCNHFVQIDSKEELEKILTKERSVIVDVRNQNEMPRINGFNVKEIPLDDLEKNLPELEQNEHLIFLCQSGIRSVKAIQSIQSKTEKKLYNIRKGISLFRT